MPRLNPIPVAPGAEFPVGPSGPSGPVEPIGPVGPLAALPENIELKKLDIFILYDDLVHVFRKAISAACVACEDTILAIAFEVILRFATAIGSVRM